MNTKRTRIADLKAGDIVSYKGGLFRIIDDARDSIGHAPKDPISGWGIGPADCAVAKAMCIDGECGAYFWPGSDWTFQGATFVTVSRVLS